MLCADRRLALLGQGTLHFCRFFFTPPGEKNLQTHLMQVRRMWEVWRAYSPPTTLTFPVQRRLRLRCTGKGDSGEASPPQIPPLRKVSYKRKNHGIHES